MFVSTVTNQSRKFHTGFVETYRYGFNGKENDDEVKGGGNSVDFGDRIYDSRLGNWLSVDPLFAKYPAFSPYCFAADNPILFVDKDGREIWISHQVNVKGKPVLQKVQYKNGELYNADGSKYTRSNSYLIAVKNHLNEIRESHPDNTKMITELETSRDNHEITNSSDRAKAKAIQFDKSLGEVNYDTPTEYKANGEVFETNTLTYFPDPYTETKDEQTGDKGSILAHELKHGHDKQTGRYKKLTDMGRTANGVRYREVSAVDTQNKVLESKGKSPRTKYGDREITKKDYEKAESVKGTK